ncbi:MAG: PepSY-like domain-containing protein [Bacteroidetes bacterium]|nr:PepSY-like domain-containing protein [Bacteroidota bacterium]
MKPIFVMLFAALLCSKTAGAQNVPQTVKAAFSKDYAKATNVKWDKEGNRYEAAFHFNDHSMSVLYDDKGRVTETETAIAIDALPKAAKQYALSKGTIKDAAKIVAANGTVRYEAEVNHKDLIFDEKGTFVTERKE